MSSDGDSLFRLNVQHITKPSSFYKQRQLECYQPQGSPTKVENKYKNLVPCRWNPSGWRYSENSSPVPKSNQPLRKSANLSVNDSYFTTSYDNSFSAISTKDNKKWNPRVFDPSISRYKIKPRNYVSPIPQDYAVLNECLQNTKAKKSLSQRPKASKIKNKELDRSIRWAGVLIHNNPNMFNKKKAEFTEFVDNISKFIMN
ncbi:unnamed protein product [Blepharisma stoltei]|uniref:Uncharacterized protein n=1 Tax=Blepharisma stoltei TaxID=1481888 RepID=A0AAU9K425_9CILI|nr:unnamed protein product [Blepharisma stoltei]